nr:ORF4b [Bat coronavirus]
MLFLLLIVVPVSCCNVSLVQYNTTFQYTIDGEYKKVEWKYNNTHLICSDGEVYEQFNTTVKCDNISLVFDIANVTLPNVTIECKTKKGEASSVTFNNTITVVTTQSPTTNPSKSLIPSTKRHYYFLLLAFIPPAWFAVLIIYYVNPSG